MLPSGPLILDRNTTSACVALRVIDNPAQQGDLTTRLGLKIEDPQFRITSNNATITFLDQPGQCPLSLILILHRNLQPRGKECILKPQQSEEYHQGRLNVIKNGISLHAAVTFIAVIITVLILKLF